MTHSGSLILCATLGGGILACSSSGTSNKDPLDLVPVDNDVPGWTVNQAVNTKNPGARAMTATTLQEAVGLIDGAAEPFYREPYAPKVFLWQSYLNPTLPAAPPDPLSNPNGATLMIYILQMPSAEQAKGLYAALVQGTGTDHTRWAGTDRDWQEPTAPPVGEVSRIQDTAAQWWVNFYQDVYYAEVMLAPSYGPPPDYDPSNADLKNEVLHFAQEIASRI